MTTTAEGLFLVGFIILALGLTKISIETPILPYSIGAMIAWLALDIGFITGEIGPGFGTLWVEAIAILFALLAFAPLVFQSLQEIQHEKVVGKETYNWISYKRRGLEPQQESSYTKRREEIRDISKRRPGRPRKRVSGTRW